MGIAIFGSSGSRKSTLAASLAVTLQIPPTELDNLHWLPEWQERADAEFRELPDVATRQSVWIIDGGYLVVRDRVWGRADAIVWLSYSFVTTAWQLLRRTVRRNTQKVPCCNGNYESVKRLLITIRFCFLISYMPQKAKCHPEHREGLVCPQM